MNDVADDLPIEAQEALGQRLKELRRRMGWVQEDLAREMSVSLSTVQRWEGKGTRPNRLARRELEKLFHKARMQNQ